MKHAVRNPFAIHPQPIRNPPAAPGRAAPSASADRGHYPDDGLVLEHLNPEERKGMRFWMGFSGIWRQHDQLMLDERNYPWITERRKQLREEFKRNGCIRSGYTAGGPDDPGFSPPGPLVAPRMMGSAEPVKPAAATAE